MWNVRAVPVAAPLLISACFVACHPQLMPIPPSHVATAPTASGPTPPRSDEKLVARKILFDPADKRDVQISPDGHQIGWLAMRDGLTTLWVGPSSDIMRAEPVAHESGGKLRAWWWSFGGDRVVFAQSMGDEGSEHLFGVDLAKKEVKDLTPVEGARAQLIALS